MGKIRKNLKNVGKIYDMGIGRWKDTWIYGMRGREKGKDEKINKKKQERRAIRY